MAAATATDPSLAQDRRLAINKSSAKISKSASLKKPSSASAPPRPIAKVVNIEASSFRRVVQELTGSPGPSPPDPLPSRPSPPSPPVEPRPSRLQRIAPPPLRPDVQQPAEQQIQNHHPHHQHSLQHQHRSQQQHMKMMVAPPPRASLSPTALHKPLSPLFHAPFFNANNTHPSTIATAFPPPGAQFAIPPLPMLSPHLLSPLPALTPGDSTWANPLDVIPPIPLSVTAPNPLSENRDCSTSTSAEVPRQLAPASQLGTSSFHVPVSPATRFNWHHSLPWSPRFAPSSLPPISPTFFPPSPGFGLGNMFSTVVPNSAAMNIGALNGMSFQGSWDKPVFRPA